MHQQVLVLNGDYQPLNITNLRRAIGLVILGKAEVLEADDGFIGSPSTRLKAPKVIRLGYYITKPRAAVRLSRRAIFARDGWCCQYCGAADRQLTVDHVVPRTRGGQNTWENLVAACKRCNNRKGGRTAEQAGMTLKKRPTQPHFILPNSYPYLTQEALDDRWRKYLEYYLPKH